MFSLFENLFSKEPMSAICINELVTLVKQNNCKEKNSSISYKPHGLFSSLGKKGLLRFSNYLYFDIDEVDDTELIKNKVLGLGACLTYRSFGYHGVHFLIRLDDEIKSESEFTHNHEYYFNYFTNLGFKLDENAKGISRMAIVGKDNNPIVQDVTLPKVHLSINKKKEIQLRLDCTKNQQQDECESKVHLSINKEEEIQLRLDCTLYKTQVEVDEDELYIVKEVENYLQIYVPDAIPDGQKHKWYRSTIIRLMTLNPEITTAELKKILHNINNKQKIKKMDTQKLIQLVESTFSWAKKNNIKAKGKTKKIHFNDKAGLSTKQKQSYARKAIAKLQKEKTIKEIKEFRLQNINATQAECAKQLGKSIRTVKTYWHHQ